MADEVYQSNVYTKQRKFHSFKKVVKQLPEPYNQMELVSYHSTSKGFTGECGMRGGYMEIINFDPDVLSEIYKLRSISLCSNTIGQLAVFLIFRLEALI